MISYKCEVCGVIKTVPPSTFKRGGRVCTRQCWGKVLEQKYDGKKKCSICKQLFERNNKNFYNNKDKGDGFTTECQTCLRRKTFERVLARDNYVKACGLTCNSCGMSHESPKFFEVDHVIPLSLLGGKRGMDDYSNGENLQILCPNCHKLKTINDRIKK